MIGFITLSVFIINICSATINYQGYKVIRVRAAGNDKDKLESWIDSQGDNVDEWSSKYLDDEQNVVEKDIMIPPENNFDDLNLDREVLIEDVAEHEHSVQGREALTMQDFAEFGTKRYHFYSEFLEYYDTLEDQYDFVSTQTIGKTHNNRPIRIVKICRPSGNCGSKPGIFVESGKHTLNHKTQMYNVL